MCDVFLTKISKDLAICQIQKKKSISYALEVFSASVFNGNNTLTIELVFHP